MIFCLSLPGAGDPGGEECLGLQVGQARVGDSGGTVSRVYPTGGRPSRDRAVVQSVAMATWAAASVTRRAQTALFSAFSTGSLLLTAPAGWSSGSGHRLAASLLPPSSRLTSGS